MFFIFLCTFLEECEKIELVENFDRFNKLKYSTAIPKVFLFYGYSQRLVVDFYHVNSCLNPDLQDFKISRICGVYLLAF